MWDNGYEQGTEPNENKLLAAVWSSMHTASPQGQGKTQTFQEQEGSNKEKRVFSHPWDSMHTLSSAAWAYSFPYKYLLRELKLVTSVQTKETCGP